MKELCNNELYSLNGGSNACDIIAGAAAGAGLLAALGVAINPLLGGAILVGGIGCWAGWW